MDDEREDEFMDSMPEPAESHAQLLELRKRFVIYLARLDEQIRRAVIKEEMDRVTEVRRPIMSYAKAVLLPRGSVIAETQKSHPL